MWIVAQISKMYVVSVLAPSSWLLHPFSTPLSFFEHSLLSGTRKCLRCICFSCPRLGSCRFSKELWFHLLESGIRKPKSWSEVFSFIHCFQALSEDRAGKYMYINPCTHTHFHTLIKKLEFILIPPFLVQYHKIHFSTSPPLLYLQCLSLITRNLAPIHNIFTCLFTTSIHNFTEYNICAHFFLLLFVVYSQNTASQDSSSFSHLLQMGTLSICNPIKFICYCSFHLGSSHLLVYSNHLFILGYVKHYIVLSIRFI